MAVLGVGLVVAIPCLPGPPNFLSCYGIETLGGSVQQHSWCLQLIAVWPPPLRSEERFQNLVLKLMETCRTPGRPAFDSLLLFPAVEMPLGGQPPSEERKGNWKAFSRPFFSPLPLGGLWWNSAVSSLGELHVYCTFCTRNACFDHRVPLNYVFFSKQLFTLHHCHFLRLELFS